MIEASRGSVAIKDAPDGALQGALAARGFKSIDLDQATLASARAVVFFPKAVDRGALRDEVIAVARQAFDAGVDLILAVPDHVLPHASSVARSIPPEADLQGERAGAAREAQRAIGANTISAFALAQAEEIANHVNGLPARFRRTTTLEIVGEFDGAHRALFESAFADATQLSVTPLLGGAVARGVYRVLAKGSENLTPLAFVAKVDRRVNILCEFGNHMLHAGDFVPFMHRPNLIPGRSQVGFDQGILVTNFVTHSASLSRAVARDGAARAIHSLFANATSGWWGRAFAKGPSKNHLLANLEDWYKPTAEPRQRALAKSAGLAAKEFGAADSIVKDLQDRLDALAPLEHWRGRVHGDLNHGNVCVQGDLPLLIDFNAMAEAALLADPAILEVSLVTECGLELLANEQKSSKDAMVNPKWVDLADALYASTALARPLPACHPPPTGEPLLEHHWAAVHAIRLHAFSIETDADQYRVLLAGALMRFASFNRDGKRRWFSAWALNKAWRLVQHLT